MIVLKYLLFFLIGFIIVGNYTLVITKNNIRTTRRFNGLIWVWLLNEKMFWKKVENLKPISDNNITTVV